MCAQALCVVAPWSRGKAYRGGRCPSGSALGARPEDGGSNPAGADGSVGPPIDSFEYRTGPPVGAGGPSSPFPRPPPPFRAPKSEGLKSSLHNPKRTVQ